MPTSKTRGYRADKKITWIKMADGKRMPVVTNTHCLKMRMGKNTRITDIMKGGIVKQRKTHTSPVTRVVNAHMDETGARDPSRKRHAATKERRAAYRTSRDKLCTAMQFMLSRDFSYDCSHD